MFKVTATVDNQHRLLISTASMEVAKTTARHFLTMPNATGVTITKEV